VLGCLIGAAIAASVSRGEQIALLSWDNQSKQAIAAQNQTNLIFQFCATNVSSELILVTNVTTSCGCTVAKLPSVPWRLAPREWGAMTVVLNTLGKRGLMSKFVNVESTAGRQRLIVTANVPIPGGDRGENQALALADPQSIFRGECARCHSEPTKGKEGHALYEAACGICHDSMHRASMVPNLGAMIFPANQAYWVGIISDGKLGTMMPGFSERHGGPLSLDQIRSLGQFALTNFAGVVETKDAQESGARK